MCFISGSNTLLSLSEILQFLLNKKIFKKSSFIYVTIKNHKFPYNFRVFFVLNINYNVTH